MPGSTITITIVDILNLDTTNSGFYYTSNKSNKEIKITTTYSNNDTQASGSTSFDMSDNSETQYYIYFKAVGIDEREVNLPTNSIIIHPYT